jgi:uncharacterized phage-associated protein
MATVTALDVAKYILTSHGASMTTMKLQKLVYYCQAWHLAWTGEPLFGDQIEAWANGPVVRVLFGRHKGMYSISVSQLNVGSAANLNKQQSAIVDTVLDTYGSMSATQLSMLTHAEEPWANARCHVPAGDTSAATISLESMTQFYRALSASPDAVHDVADVNFPAWA